MLTKSLSPFKRMVRRGTLFSKEHLFFHIHNILFLIPDVFLRLQEPRSERYLIAMNKDGLCNRLKCLISCMRLATKLSRTVELYWPKNHKCGCHFSDLFENKILERRSEMSVRWLAGKTDKYLPVDTWRLLVFPAELSNHSAREHPSLCQSGHDIDFEFERIPLSIRHDYLNYLDRLIPSRYVREQVETYSKLFDDRTISLSIRSWPEEDMRRESLFRIENVYAVIDRYNAANFFVSSDADWILNNLILKYGRRILFYPKRKAGSGRNSRTGMQDILIDLLLLSKNKHLVASYFSTFSELAWWFGGCKAKVEILESPADIESFRKKFFETEAGRREAVIVTSKASTALRGQPNSAVMP